MTAKKLALANGEKTYIGSPCSHCGRKTRYTSNSHCLYCRSQRVNRTDLRCTSSICDENSVLGSVYCAPHATISKMLVRAKEAKVQYDASVWLWPERLRLIGPICVYCDAPYDHVEHVIPMSSKYKGPHKLFNLVPACWECNLVKGTKLPHERWPDVDEWSIYVIEAIDLYLPKYMEFYKKVKNVC